MLWRNRVTPEFLEIMLAGQKNRVSTVAHPFAWRLWVRTLMRDIYPKPKARAIVRTPALVWVLSVGRSRSRGVGRPVESQAAIAGLLQAPYYLYMVPVHGGGHITDSAVVLAGGGAEAMARLAEVLLARVRLMVTARLSPKPSQYDAIEDITQRAMLAWTQGFHTLQNRTVGGLNAYLSGIVAHKVADYIQGKRGSDGVRRGQQSPASSQAGIETAGSVWQFLSAAGSTPSSVAARAEQVEHLMHELGNLKSEHRHVLTLAFLDQLSTGQIAEQLGISRPAVSMRLIRAIRSLRRRMTGSSRIEDQP